MDLGELLDGAPTRTRTADLLITNQLLYQLSYRGLLVKVLTSEAVDMAKILGRVKYFLCLFQTIIGLILSAFGEEAKLLDIS